MRLNTLLGRYWRHAELRLRPRTASNRRYLLETLRRELGRHPIEQLGPEMVDRYARRRLGAGLRPPSVNSELRLLNTILHFAVARKLLQSAPKVTLLPEPEWRVRYWTRQEVRRLLDQLERRSPELVPLVTFLAHTGCRCGEGLVLEWSRVNLARRVIEIWPSRSWRPKSGKPREVPLSDELVPYLTAPRGSPRWVFPSRRGKHWARWPQRRFDEARRAAGLQGGPHTLRHSFASEFLARKPDINLLAQILGHSDARTTRLYAHLLPDHLDSARNVVSYARRRSPAGAVWRAFRALLQLLGIPTRNA